MEHGFFHPSRGYWQTTTEPSSAILATYPAGTAEVPLKPGADHEWIGGEWVHTPPPPEELLAQERTGMMCSPAQMRLTLLNMGILDQVQTIADSDPAASIVWEYATRLDRLSPLIDALGGPNGFTPEQIDDIFRAAMMVNI